MFLPLLLLRSAVPVIVNVSNGLGSSARRDVLDQAAQGQHARGGALPGLLVGQWLYDWWERIDTWISQNRPRNVEFSEAVEVPEDAVVVSEEAVAVAGDDTGTRPRSRSELNAVPREKKLAQ